ncbi:MAG: response regulator transcription factor [Acidimicrobiia bacterium]|nr:response regulator transcription factor [Acidimicrobiia bacterium]MDH4362582.1 response regulator transcription factor [Acidimicrobiia bacterium]MDH5288902.1 response regulator transcription factor [Acidimicrobiia bacterium]
MNDSLVADSAATGAGATRIRVAVADDHAIVRQGLERLFSTAGDMELVGTAASGNEAVDLVESARPDVILMDLSMPDGDGVDATRRIVAAGASTRVVILTSFGEESRILDALNAGAQGYLLKHIDPDMLLDAVRSAAQGDAPLDPRAGRVLLEQRRAPADAGSGLTDRELEVLSLVGQGLANKQIARRLGISERTVKAHLTSVFQRIGVSDRVQAALWLRDHQGR